MAIFGWGNIWGLFGWGGETTGETFYYEGDISLSLNVSSAQVLIAKPETNIDIVLEISADVERAQVGTIILELIPESEYVAEYAYEGNIGLSLMPASNIAVDVVIETEGFEISLLPLALIAIKPAISGFSIELGLSAESLADYKPSTNISLSLIPSVEAIADYVSQQDGFSFALLPISYVFGWRCQQRQDNSFACVERQANEWQITNRQTINFNEVQR